MFFITSKLIVDPFNLLKTSGSYTYSGIWKLAGNIRQAKEKGEVIFFRWKLIKLLQNRRQR